MLRQSYDERTAAILQEFGQDGLNLAGKYGDDLAKIIDNLEHAEAKKAVNLINSYGNEALELFKEGKDADEVKKIVEGGLNSYADFSKAISDIGMRSDLTDAQKIRELQKLFEELTKERFQIIEGETLGEVSFKNTKGLLSSGYQAIVRILLELLYYQEKCVESKNLEHPVVIIDELDEFLSPGYAFLIMPFLKTKFPKMEFIITTHSCDLVAGAQNANLIILKDDEYEVLDINDLQSISEVQIIFDRVFGEHAVKENEIEMELRRLLNNKINNAWGEREQIQLKEIQRKNLTASQQIICKQISEW